MQLIPAVLGDRGYRWSEKWAGEATVEFCVSSDLARSGAGQLGIGHFGMVLLVHAPVSKSQESACNGFRLCSDRRFICGVTLAAAGDFRANGYCTEARRLCGIVRMDDQLHMCRYLNRQERDQMAEIVWGRRQQSYAST